MRILTTLAAITLLTTTLTACGGTDEKTVYHERTVVVPQAVPGANPSDVENSCAHGYDNATHRCY